MVWRDGPNVAPTEGVAVAYGAEERVCGCVERPSIAFGAGDPNELGVGVRETDGVRVEPAMGRPAAELGAVTEPGLSLPVIPRVSIGLDEGADGEFAKRES